MSENKTKEFNDEIEEELDEETQEAYALKSSLEEGFGFEGFDSFSVSEFEEFDF